jgi:hypothetical protein
VEDFDAYINDLKARVDLVAEIGADEPLTQRGRAWRGTRHDSLQVSPEVGLWNWHSRDIGGDVFCWCKMVRGWDFKRAVEELARKYQLPDPGWGRESAQARLAAQVRSDVYDAAMAVFRRMLKDGEAGARYCKARGWSGETARDEALGYWTGDKAALMGAFQTHGVDVNSAAARALLTMPAQMLVYAHREWGRVVYFSTRFPATLEDDGAAFVVWNAITDQTTRLEYDEKTREAQRRKALELSKRHWNLPRDTAGDRRPYWNCVARVDGGDLVVVEGQADAVTLAQWGIPAVALAGVRVADTDDGRRLLLLLAKHERLTVGLDADAAGMGGVLPLAEALGPKIHVVRWPSHDVNEWAVNFGGDAAAAVELVARAPLFIEVYAQQVGQLENSERERGLRKLFEFVGRLDAFSRDVLRQGVADAAKLKLRDFDRLLKTTEKEGGAGGDDPLVTVQVIGGQVDGYLLETLHLPSAGGAGATSRTPGKTLLAMRTPAGDIHTAPFVDSNGIRYVPPAPENPVLVEGVVRFAPRVGELYTTRELVRKVQATINRYMDVDVFYETLSAYYVLFTWLHDAFNTLPYLRVLGDAGSGKSRFLQVVGSLCYRPLTVTGAATTSPIFRLIDRYRGTLVMDEGDFGKSDEAADIIKIFNTGYQRSQGIVLRAGAKENNFEPEVFVVYGPKVLATRQRFQDWAVESRCITKEMGGPTTREDIPIELPREFWTEEVPDLHALLLRYRLEHWRPEIALDFSQLDNSLEPRLNQVMLALVSIVDDEDLKEDLRAFMRQYNAQLIAERGLTLTAKVLEAVVGQWEIENEKEEGKRDMSLKTLAHRADQLMDFENLDEDEEYQGRRLTGKKVGEIARKQLQLQTARSSQMNGRYEVVWNEARVVGLRKRYGIDDARLRDICAAIYDQEAKEQERKAQAAQAAQRAFGG